MRSLVQIRAAPNVEMMEISFIILFTKFIFLNEFYPLCPLRKWLCSVVVKAPVL